MQKETLEQFSQQYKTLLENRLSGAVNELDAPGTLKEAMLYSLEAGGKRIRPLLLFATLKAFGCKPEKGLDAAAAIEMVHTYSLIHDDLPSMDNDDLRRGKPTNHKVYGEAAAILAGDALLTLSFKLLAQLPAEVADGETKLSLVAGLSDAAGAGGMVGGQIADMEGEGRQLTLKELEYIHINKTGRLLMYSVIAGAEIAGASAEVKRTLETFAHHIGLAFQIRDDILDLVGNEAEIGKRVGSDALNEKSTYPALLSLDGAKEALNVHIGQAKELLAQTGLDTDMLEQITNLIGLRKS
ncbi:farnesyl-diphosphate synthase [Mesobacillus campisalis]|uniref:Farnesyl diphosphate synthase n=1 Tax=Mesobacillus campisalis TaxID=1408103 RepID=A0A0M2SG33_9BACI|nr:farnesyl diphosphate synthase [Mesobacillus campisalis]KKK33243.1 farnesyl-diphosphate synthase [Mesobacillus campisalis]